jgi:prepilin-type N-terminal cleavage/methylation domain-containing protein
MERNWHIPTDKKAFTLVELVIVIVIVGILSTIFRFGLFFAFIKGN